MENQNQIETRNCKDEIRALEKDGEKYIEGYALLYNQRSKLMFGWGDPFYETIESNALDEVLSNTELDIIHTPNHNYDLVVARTKSGTLQLVNDERGLKYIAKLSNTTYSNDLYESVKRGDLYESSFTFLIAENGESWSITDEGIDLRTVKKIGLLKETSTVTWGAYANTDVAARSLENLNKEYNEQQPAESEKPKIDEVETNGGPSPENPQIDLMKFKLKLIKIKK